MENLQEQIEKTQTVLLENILESVDAYHAETNSPITVGELYSLCEYTINFIIEQEQNYLLSEETKGRKGELKSGPASKPWQNKKLVKFRSLRKSNAKRLEETATEQDLLETTDAMIEALIAEGMLDTIQKVGDVASFIPGGIGRGIGLANAAVSGARFLAGNKAQGSMALQRALLPGGAMTGGLLGRGISALGGLRQIPGFGGFGRPAAGAAAAPAAGAAAAPAAGAAAAAPAAGAAAARVRPARSFMDRLPAYGRLAGQAISRGLAQAGGTRGFRQNLAQAGSAFMSGLRSGRTPATTVARPSAPAAGPSATVATTVARPSAPPRGFVSAAPPVLQENTLPDYIRVGIGQPFSNNTKPTTDELNVINSILSEGKITTRVKKKTKVKEPVIGEGPLVTYPTHVGTQGLSTVTQHGVRSMYDPLAMRGTYGASLGEDILKEYVKNPVANKVKKQKFKIVFNEGGKKLEAFAGSERGVKRAVYGKKNYRVYSATGTDVTGKFKGK